MYKMLRAHLIGYGLAFLVLLTGVMPLLVSSCSPEDDVTSMFLSKMQIVVDPADNPGLSAPGYYMGVLPMPDETRNFAEAFELASTCADFAPVWGRPTPFYDLADDIKGAWGDRFVESYTRGNGMFPLVNMSFISRNMTLASPPGITKPTLSHPVWREAYKKAALDIVKAARPRYFSLGNEVNRWYETYGDSDGDPNAFRNFISLYEETYDAVKKLSPETVVFCTFAREVVSDQRTADMNVIEMFDPAKLDAVLITSYPHAVAEINTPADIPDDYYAQIAEIFPYKRFGFTEIAWPSLEAFGGQEAQADFLVQLTGRLTIGQNIDLFMIGWPWLTDLDDHDTLGLIKRDGSVKQAFHVWRSLAVLGKYVDREDAIPSDAEKVLTEDDPLPPVLHSDAYYEPVPVDYPVSTAGAEDSAFIMPDGQTLYFFFTPDVRVPVDEQIVDGVTGIYVAYLQEDNIWSTPERVILNDSISLDGCVYVKDDIMWFCSAREGYTGLNWFTANRTGEIWGGWSYSGDEFPEYFEVGELHFSSDGNEVYYHSARPGGQGNYDIWYSQRIDGVWQEPENIAAVNSPDNDGWPYLTEDGAELWFTRTYLGSPAIFVSRLLNGAWSEPELIISQFAGEASLDAAGNIYFTHHYFNYGEMIEADIYVARRK